ncbi:hypothetical protein H4Q26_013822 [Puccinia striiformis f. sp. tritici PST-130]|nr:hypothetical protein H4Q26_013822 [Puccinia striiformis f. sp. tritici PST-130]
MVVQQERPSNAHGSEIGEASSPESRDHEYCEVPSVRIICLRAYRSTSSGREDDIFAALGNTHAGDIPGWPSTTTIHQYGLKMVSSGPVVRIRLLLVQLGLWMVCNGSENPARRVTLNLFPGGNGGPILYFTIFAL